VKNYNLQRYLFDALQLKHLIEERDACTTQFAGCRWAVRRAVELQDQITMIADRMKAYENTPENRGG